MQIAKPNLKVPARRVVAQIASAPVMVALALSSIVITLVVALGTVMDGRLPASGSLGLVCALVLAALAAAEASRPARAERVRRQTTRSPKCFEDPADADASALPPWR